MQGLPYTPEMTEALQRLLAQIARREQIDRLTDVLAGIAIGLLCIGGVLLLATVTGALVGL